MFTLKNPYRVYYIILIIHCYYPFNFFVVLYICCIFIIMGKYVITESQLKKVVYGILNPRVVGIYVEDLSRYPYYHYKVKEVDTHYIILNILGKKKFTITHMSYKDNRGGEHDNRIIFKESLVEFISKVVRIRKTKSMDMIADWVEEMYNLNVDNIEFSDSSFTHGITKYLKKIK